MFFIKNPGTGLSTPALGNHLFKDLLNFQAITGYLIHKPVHPDCGAPQILFLVMIAIKGA